MTALGLEPSGGAVRAGYLHYTTPEEADALLRGRVGSGPTLTGRLAGRHTS